MVRTGGSSTRYFFNLEKRNHSNKYITNLRVKNRTSTSSDEIFNEEHRYYKRSILFIAIFKAALLIIVMERCFLN